MSSSPDLVLYASKKKDVRFMSNPEIASEVEEKALIIGLEVISQVNSRVNSRVNSPRSRNSSVFTFIEMDEIPSG